MNKPSNYPAHVLPKTGSKNVTKPTAGLCKDKCGKKSGTC